MGKTLRRPRNNGDIERLVEELSDDEADEVLQNPVVRGYIKRAKTRTA